MTPEAEAREWKRAAELWESAAHAKEALLESKEEMIRILLAQLENANKRAAFWEQMVHTQTWVMGNP